MNDHYRAAADAFFKIFGMERVGNMINYYYVINGDGTTHEGFLPFGDGPIPPVPGAEAYAPDWDPDPTRECGGALHVVGDHPLLAFQFVNRTNPIYLQVEPIDAFPELKGKIRCRGVRVISVSRKMPPWPAGLSMKSLSLRGCTGLKALPVSLKVGTSLDLGGCTGLKALPAGLTVGGSLNLGGCTGLKALPVSLKVGTSLNLCGCTGLKALPVSLKVGTSLNLCGCTGLKALPKTLKVKGMIYRD